MPYAASQFRQHQSSFAFFYAAVSIFLLDLIFDTREPLIPKVEVHITQPFFFAAMLSNVQSFRVTKKARSSSSLYKIFFCFLRCIGKKGLRFFLSLKIPFLAGTTTWVTSFSKNGFSKNASHYEMHFKPSYKNCRKCL